MYSLDYKHNVYVFIRFVPDTDRPETPYNLVFCFFFKTTDFFFYHFNENIEII